MTLSRGKLWSTVAGVALCVTAMSAIAQRRISEDRDLKELDLSAWNCKDQPGGSAKTPDGVDRNKGKNREPIPLAGIDPPQLDSAGFLRHVAAFEAQTKGKRRKDLTAQQSADLQELQKQVVSLTAYLGVVYAGPPETTNCGEADPHDWHMELFEKPIEHAPQIGDPTPIICEITPRTQNGIFQDGTRLQKLAGFFRTPDLQNETLPQNPHRVRITGYLLWDDEHNGSADVGTTVNKFAGNGFHQPWRLTAWEIHPVVKIEPANGQNFTPAAAEPAAPSGAADGTAPTSAPPQRSAAPSPPAAPDVTVITPVKVRIRYGETVLQPGTRLPLVKRDANTVTVKYMNENIYLPLLSTDQH